MIIGFAGPKRSGKDYAYHIIKKRFPRDEIERVAFADPIKEKICDIFNINRNELENLKTQVDFCVKNKDNSYGSFTGRNLIVGIGTLMRSYNEHQFEDYVKGIVESNPNRLYICTDVRYQSEVDLIHSLGGIVVQIQRDGVEYEGTETERGIKDYDYIIKNDFNYEQNLVTLAIKGIINVHSRKNIRV